MFQASHCPHRSIFRTHLSQDRRRDGRDGLWRACSCQRTRLAVIQRQTAERVGSCRRGRGRRDFRAGGPRERSGRCSRTRRRAHKTSCGPPSWPHGRAARETGQDGRGGPAGLAPGSLGRRALANLTAVSPRRPPLGPLPPEPRSVGDNARETGGPSREGETGSPSPRWRSARRRRPLLDSGPHTAEGGGPVSCQGFPVEQGCRSVHARPVQYLLHRLGSSARHFPK